MSLAGNSLLGTGVSTLPVAVAPGQSLALAGFNTTAASQARLTALTNLLTSDNGVSLVQAANGTMSDSIADASALTAALAKVTPFKTVFPKTGLAASYRRSPRSSRCPPI